MYPKIEQLITSNLLIKEVLEHFVENQNQEESPLPKQSLEIIEK
jgi:hypothetical protein